MKKTIAFTMLCAFGACAPTALVGSAAAQEAPAATTVSAYVVSFSGGG